MTPDGVVLWDKPRGITSHDVVAHARRGLPKGVKVGHAGTLDPFATGLLLILIGRATRVQRLAAISTKPSSASRLRASRTGMRLTPRRAASGASARPLSQRVLTMSVCHRPCTTSTSAPPARWPA